MDLSDYIQLIDAYYASKEQGFAGSFDDFKSVLTENPEFFSMPTPDPSKMMANGGVVNQGIGGLFYGR